MIATTYLKKNWVNSKNHFFQCTLVYPKWLQKRYKNYFSLRSGQSFKIYKIGFRWPNCGQHCIVCCWLKLQFQESCTHWASFIKCCEETILNLILQSSLKYAYVCDSWTYSTHRKRTWSLSDVKSMNRKWSWTCTRLNGFSSLLVNDS